MKKIILKKILSHLNLLSIIEQINFYRQKWKNRKSNKKFKKNNPKVKLPPDFYLYETFNLNYDKFYTNGIPTATWLINHLSQFKKLENISILDWGCGTGRILRHLPLTLKKTNTFYGTDYNKKYVKWCSENLEGIHFKNNDLHPPLQFKDDFLDIIYGISIFTHLSEELHYSWMTELTRVLKNNGLLFLTTHGDAHTFKLLPKELELYNSGSLITHTYKKEGNRLFASYQSPKFLKDVFAKNNLIVLNHIP
ncbi:class I SAM-dependent methyltransferase [Polaribacter sp. HL-MS24]|uniref:class I SAM-dependent methyltransferase n=1 Tax=Polaribacter sp. HL-MS24 TaxID=3077735 RepID=UPI0029342167|nr:class I SAM-dependent methyltransferase [Polaribacter sp. HL-MS24]WOC41263.1 class I SAM-dependent methyltransferase [Polaribacter sp. HL-MS24]